MSLAYDGAAWSTGDTAEPDVTVRGPDSDLALFALGRGSIAERHLEVDGDLNRADDFRVHVPGL